MGLERVPWLLLRGHVDGAAGLEHGVGGLDGVGLRLDVGLRALDAAAAAVTRPTSCCCWTSCCWTAFARERVVGFESARERGANGGAVGESGFGVWAVSIGAVSVDSRGVARLSGLSWLYR